MGAIVLEKINKQFSSVKALNNVSLNITEGEFFTLLGPSGCGKTTLLRTIAGFQTQDSGHVYLAGEIIDDIPAYRRNTGMVFQNYAIFPHLTVFENVAFGLKVKNTNKPAIVKAKVVKALAQVHLQGYEKRTPDQLSGGQQQRVGLARAMVIEPKVLLMDEPLSNLDAKLRVEMREEICRVQKKLNITTIYVTHDQEEALAISDRIAVMNNGIMQQCGTPWEIYKNPQNVFVASFVGNMNFIVAEIDDAGSDGFHLRVGDAHTTIALEKNISTKKINVAVRPEDVQLNLKPSKLPDTISIPGVVIESFFVGTLIRFRVECANGMILVVDQYKPQQSDFIELNRTVYITISLDTVLFFDLETGARL